MSNSHGNSTAKQINYLTHRYADTLLQSGAFHTEGGSESLSEWIRRGMFFHFAWPKVCLCKSLLFGGIVFLRHALNHELKCIFVCVERVTWLTMRLWQTKHQENSLPCGSCFCCRTPWRAAPASMSTFSLRVRLPTGFSTRSCSSVNGERRFTFATRMAA